MFARLKETVRILTYRQPVVHGPDAVIVEKPAKPGAPGFGKFVAFVIEAAIYVYAVGFIAGHLGGTLSHFHPFRSVSLTTLAGALGAVILWVGHSLLNDLQLLLKKRLNLAEKLAPFFGHKVEETYRALRS